MDPVCSQQNDIRDLRAHIAADGMRKTVFQVSVSNRGWQIPDDHTFILLHHCVDLFLALTDMNLAADIIFILSGIHLMDDITRITVSVDNQESSGPIKFRINISGSPNPQNRYHDLDQSHFYKRPCR